MVIASLQLPFLWEGGKCCCLRSLGHPAHQPQLFTPLPVHFGSPHVASLHEIVPLGLFPVFPTPVSFQAVPRTNALQLWVSWPPFLAVSIPPVLTSESNILFFSCQCLLIPVRSCCVCWCERFVWETSSPPCREISHPRAVSGAWTRCR